MAHIVCRWFLPLSLNLLVNYYLRMWALTPSSSQQIMVSSSCTCVWSLPRKVEEATHNHYHLLHPLSLDPKTKKWLMAISEGLLQHNEWSFSIMWVCANVESIRWLGMIQWHGNASWVDIMPYTHWQGIHKPTSSKMELNSLGDLIIKEY